MPLSLAEFFAFPCSRFAIHLFEEPLVGLLFGDSRQVRVQGGLLLNCLLLTWLLLNCLPAVGDGNLGALDVVNDGVLQMFR